MAAMRKDNVKSVLRMREAVAQWGLQNGMLIYRIELA